MTAILARLEQEALDQPKEERAFLADRKSSRTHPASNRVSTRPLNLMVSSFRWDKDPVAAPRNFRLRRRSIPRHAIGDARDQVKTIIRHG